WSIVATVTLLAGLGLFVAFPPAYKAQTTILLKPFPDIQPTDGILTDIALAQSPAVAQSAVQQLGLPPQSAGSFLNAYSATEVTDQVVTITLGASSSDEAVRRANAVATAFLQFRAQQAQGQLYSALKSIDRQVADAQQNVTKLEADVAQLTQQPTTPAQQGQLAVKQSQLKQANFELGQIQAAAISERMTETSATATVVDDTKVVAVAQP